MAGFRARSESSRKPTTPGVSGEPTSTKHQGKGSGSRRSTERKAGTRPSQRATGYEQQRPAERQAKARAGGSGDPSRDVALATLREVTVNDAYANLVLPKMLKERRVTGRDAAFATELAYGCLRATGLLDAIITDAAGRPVEKIDSMALDILRLGAYQILRTRVDDHAAVNTSVELAKSHGAGQASGFVNGVLRTIARRSPESWVERVAGGQGLDALALRTAHPVWIAQAFNDSLHRNSQIGAITGETPQAMHPELALALAADDTRPVVHLAARPGEISAEELALVSGGREGKYSPYAVYLDDGAPGDVDAVRDGVASVQDEGSQLIALALLRAPLLREDGGRWLDLCSGPGGKTGFIASWGQADQAHVTAVEVAPHRAELVRTSTRGLPVTVHVGDGRRLDSIAGLELPADGFDRVLVDAPCSGLGALRRRPEARWRKSPADIPELVSLQRELLRSALAATADGGVTVYSTCSPHMAETADVVRSVAAETGAEILDLTSALPELFARPDDPSEQSRGDNAEAPFIQLWPHRHGADAMFIAALRPPSGANT